MSIRCDIGLFDANPSIDHQSVASTRQVIYGPSITDGHRLTGHRHRLAQVTSIYRQSIGDQLVTNLGTRVLWRPTEVSSRRTNRAALGLSNRSKQRNDSPNGSPSSANTMPIQCQSIAMQNQSKTNGLPILASSICKSIQMWCKTDAHKSIQPILCQKVSIHHQSDVNPMLSQCQSYANSLQTWCKISADPPIFDQNTELWTNPT